MNAATFLEIYDRVKDAPDAVGRMRRFVLDLAVRGKLVEQDPDDEPASELYSQISKRREKLAHERNSRKQSMLQITSDNLPFKIPSNWRWVRFGQIADFSAGKTPSRNEASFWNTGHYSWVSIADMEHGETITTTKETVSAAAYRKVFKSEPNSSGTILLSFKLTIGKISRLGIPAFHNEAIISIRPHLQDLDPYIFTILPDCARRGESIQAVKGMTLNRASISNILFPLSPLAEQHRIVAKVNELMAMLDQICENLKKGKDRQVKLLDSVLREMLCQ